MAKNTPQALMAVVSENDVTSLFSRFGQFAAQSPYREVRRNDAAFHAACRWPLLAEIQGIPTSADEQILK